MRGEERRGRTGVCIVWESVSGPLARAGGAGGVEPRVQGEGIGNLVVAAGTG